MANVHRISQNGDLILAIFGVSLPSFYLIIFMKPLNYTWAKVVRRFFIHALSWEMGVVTSVSPVIY